MRGRAGMSERADSFRGGALRCHVQTFEFVNDDEILDVFYEMILPRLRLRKCKCIGFHLGASAMRRIIRARASA